MKKIGQVNIFNKIEEILYLWEISAFIIIAWQKEGQNKSICRIIKVLVEHENVCYYCEYG